MRILCNMCGRIATAFDFKQRWNLLGSNIGMKRLSQFGGSGARDWKIQKPICHVYLPSSDSLGVCFGECPADPWMIPPQTLFSSSEQPKLYGNQSGNQYTRQWQFVNSLKFKMDRKVENYFFPNLPITCSLTNTILPPEKSRDLQSLFHHQGQTKRSLEESRAGPASKFSEENSNGDQARIDEPNTRGTNSAG